MRGESASDLTDDGSSAVRDEGDGLLTGVTAALVCLRRNGSLSLLDDAEGVRLAEDPCSLYGLLDNDGKLAPEGERT